MLSLLNQKLQWDNLLGCDRPILMSIQLGSRRKTIKAFYIFMQQKIWTVWFEFGFSDFIS